MFEDMERKQSWVSTKSEIRAPSKRPGITFNPTLESYVEEPVRRSDPRSSSQRPSGLLIKRRVAKFSDADERSRGATKDYGFLSHRIVGTPYPRVASPIDAEALRERLEDTKKVGDDDDEDSTDVDTPKEHTKIHGKMYIPTPFPRHVRPVDPKALTERLTASAALTSMDDIANEALHWKSFLFLQKRKDLERFEFSLTRQRIEDLRLHPASTKGRSLRSSEIRYSRLTPPQLYVS